jgi:hypothetical protein
VDWNAIGQAIGPSGDSETLSFQLAGQASGGKPLLPSPPMLPTNLPSFSRDWLSTLPEGAKRRAVLALPIVVLAALGGGVAAWIVGLPIISVALAGGTGIWLGGTVSGTLAANNPDAAQLLARGFVHEQIVQAKQYVTLQLRERFAYGKKNWQQEIDRLRGLLDSSALATAAPSQANQSEAQILLDELRNRIMRTLT